MLLFPRYCSDKQAGYVIPCYTTVQYSRIYMEKIVAKSKNCYFGKRCRNMSSKIVAVACFALWTSACRACDDLGNFKHLKTAKASVKSARDGFEMSVFGDPDKYIPHSMYIGKSARVRVVAIPEKIHLQECFGNAHEL